MLRRGSPGPDLIKRTSNFCAAAVSGDEAFRSGSDCCDQATPHQVMEGPTHFSHQSCGKAPLDQPQDIRLTTGLTNSTVRHERGDRVRRLRLNRANGP